jgi:hypothetical protein
MGSWWKRKIILQVIFNPFLVQTFWRCVMGKLIFGIATVVLGLTAYNMAAGGDMLGFGVGILALISFVFFIGAK